MKKHVDVSESASYPAWHDGIREIAALNEAVALIFQELSGKRNAMSNKKSLFPPDNELIERLRPWKALKKGARIISDYHLIIRYLLDTHTYTPELLAVYCKKPLRAVLRAMYGTGNREECNTIGRLITKRMKIDRHTLLPMAKEWQTYNGLDFADHLLFRYILGAKIYSVEDLSAICDMAPKEIEGVAYNTGTRARRGGRAALVSERLKIHLHKLMLAAQKWRAGGDVHKIPAQAEGLGTPVMRGGFRKEWLKKMGWDERQLTFFLQNTSFLEADGILPGDFLLINIADKTFHAGSFYLVSIEGETRICKGALVKTRRALLIEPSKKKLVPKDFDADRQAGLIIGRVVWRGALMP